MPHALNLGPSAPIAQTAALDIRSADPVTLPLDSILRDPALICRAAGINKRVVAEYAGALAAGAVFPPIVVFVDTKGVHHLADGYHRTAACEVAALVEIAADVRRGSRKDALLFAATKANADHGLRRSPADKRKAVLLLLAAFPKWSDRKIGEACTVDHKTVGAARARMQPPTGGEFPTAEPGTSEAGTDGTTAAAERLVVKLSRSIDKLVQQWPPGHHEALGKLLDGYRVAS